MPRPSLRLDRRPGPLPLIALAAALAASPAAGQPPSFGDDSSDWADDGECDDPRFVGPGMTRTMLLDEDAHADATDCREAFEAGRVRLRPAPPLPSGLPMGDDGGRHALDGECDDRRFAGPGMASSLHWENAGRDATDCAARLADGTVTPWSAAEAGAATRCEFIPFGDDAGDYALDGACDDPRFEGRGTSVLMVPTDLRRDASDCRRLCEMGAAALRDYRAY